MLPQEVVVIALHKLGVCPREILRHRKGERQYSTEPPSIKMTSNSLLSSHLFFVQLVKHADGDVVFVFVFFCQHPELFDYFRVAVLVIESLAEAHYTAECNVPPIYASGVECFGDGGLATPAFNHLVNLSSVEVASMDKRVACLASSQDEVVRERLVTSARVGALSSVSLCAIADVIAYRCCESARGP
jgi:hypothetical protein